MEQIPIGIKIKVIRTLRGMLQVDLASKAGIKRTTIIDIERGDILPGDHYKQAIEAALGLQLDAPEVEAAFAILTAMSEDVSLENPPRMFRSGRVADEGIRQRDLTDKLAIGPEDYVIS